MADWSDICSPGSRSSGGSGLTAQFGNPWLRFSFGRLKKQKAQFSNWAFCLILGSSTWTVTKLAEIHLNDAEYGVLERFRGHEIRKNTYFHEFDRMVWTFDCYLGEARGLNIAKSDLDSREQMTDLVPPPFALIEITGDPFFSGEKLVAKDYAEISAEVERIGSQIPPVSEMPDE